MSSILLASSGIAITAMILLYLLLRRERRFTAAYPPGPKVSTMPSHDAWVEYRNWGREYGQYSHCFS